MLKDFDLAAKRHELIKEAFAALAAKPALAAAKWVGSKIMNNKALAVGTSLAAIDVGAGTKAMSQAVRKTPVDVPGTFTAGAQTF